MFLKSLKFYREINPLLYDYIYSHISFIESLVDFFSKKRTDIVDIEIIGDIHWIQTTKLLLLFSNGEKKVVIWNRCANDFLLAWLEKFVGLKNISFFRYTSRQDLVYREYLPYYNDFQSWVAIENFYFNFWAKVAFCLALRVIDLHYENIFISNNDPIFCDLECAFAPLIHDEEYSIYLSGILDTPSWEESFWPLFGGREQRMSLLTPILSSYWRYPKISWTVFSKFQKMHIPQSSWKNINPFLYSDSFLKGFDKVANTIIRRKKFFISFIEHLSFINRILFRPTRVYVALLSDMVMQISLYRLKDIDVFLYQKLDILPLFSPVMDKKSLILEEINYLKRWLIPSFYTDIHDVKVFSERSEYLTTLFTSCGSEFRLHCKNIEAFYQNVRKQLILAFHKVNYDENH